MKKWVSLCYVFCINVNAYITCTRDVSKDLTRSCNSSAFSAPLHMDQISAVQKSLLSSRHNSTKSEDLARST